MFLPKVSWVSNVFVKHQRCKLAKFIRKQFYRRATKKVLHRSRIILVEARKYCFILGQDAGMKVIALINAIIRESG